MARKRSSFVKTVGKLRGRGYSVSVRRDIAVGTRRVTATKQIGTRSVALHFDIKAGRGSRHSNSPGGFLKSSTPAGAFRGRAVKLGGIRRDSRGRFK